MKLFRLASRCSLNGRVRGWEHLREEERETDVWSLHAAQGSGSVLLTAKSKLAR